MPNTQEILIPDIGDFENIDVIDVLVKVGDSVNIETPLLALESDKATMEIPSPIAGIITEIKIKIGDKVSQGIAIMCVDTEQSNTEQESAETSDPKQNDTTNETAPPHTATVEPPATTDTTTEPSQEPKTNQQVQTVTTSPTEKAHASPTVRRFARELGVDLSLIHGSGPKDRILKQDVKQFTKSILSGDNLANTTGITPPKTPPVDFSKFGETELKPLSRLKQLGGKALHSNWITIPHVTQFDTADITELEDFRKSKLNSAKTEGVKLTLMAFLVKAAVVALKELPEFNASLSPDGMGLVVKKYFHIGIAVNTENGLLVPIIKDADTKGLFDIANEIIRLSEKAKKGQLTPTDMQGGCFTISSLGSVGGGKGFTPIINAPEVAILGVSRATIQPVYKDEKLLPRLILPYSLSYDHRVIDGVAGAQFAKFLNTILVDIRHILL
ncbi:Dihydrolipoamide acetyltransferase component of pyruvate dehydrogenase complex [uncultured Candidatus Thioglobus sp.]|nr:Dihydrolipoamide acetyltransferase component of pyruvate dehydrogenase complex [uncultured Candidatus Thioglobus sp.]